jgi:hypothetical protein
VSRLSPANDGALWTLTISGALGFWLGAAVFAEWQVAVETAQVIAGLVSYPPDNPFYIYHVRLWTVLHELLAVLLRFGVWEVTASKLVSGLIIMVSLQALSMVVYGLSRNVLFATGGAFVVFLSRAAEIGGRYPISLAGTQHTYGALGLSALVLTAGLLGSGRYRLGGLLLGAMPAIHPGLGVWAFVIVALCLASGFRRMSVLLRPALPWFIAGCVFTASSLIVHLAIAPAAVPADPAGADYLPTLVRFWDGHRQAVPLTHPAVYLNLAAVPLALTWLVFLADRLPPASVVLLRFVAASGGLAVAFVFLTWAPPEWIPDVVQILMPLRLLNIASMMFAAVLLGLIGAYHHTLPGQLGMLALAVTLLLLPESQFWSAMPDAVLRVLEGPPVDRLTMMLAGAVGVTSYALIDRRARARARNAAAGAPSLGPIRPIAAVRNMLLVSVIVTSVASLRDPWPRALKFRDRTHDPVFAAASAADGLLLTANGVRLAQLKTRRPVLLDTSGFDGLPYSLEAAPRMIHILRDVYEIDLLTAPTEPPVESNRRAWERYSLERWQEIGRTYGVTQVLTLRDWRLRLPVAVETADLRLYQIP